MKKLDAVDAQANRRRPHPTGASLFSMSYSRYLSPANLRPRFFSIRKARMMTGIDCDTLLNLERSGLLPPRVFIGDKSKRFIADELEIVFDARNSGKSDNELRELVLEIVKKRKGDV